VRIGRTFVTRVWSESLPRAIRKRQDQYTRGLIPGDSVSDPFHVSQCGGLLRTICFAPLSGQSSNVIVRVGLLTNVAVYTAVFRSSELRCPLYEAVQRKIKSVLEGLKPSLFNGRRTSCRSPIVMASTFLFTAVPQATPTLPPPPFPADRPPPLFPIDKPGLCGLTGHEWRLVLKISVPLSGRPFIFAFPFHAHIKGDPVSVLAVLIPLLILVVISWLNSVDISDMWLQAQQHAETTRTGTFSLFYFIIGTITDELFTISTRISQGLRERLYGHLLSEDDIRSGLIDTGPIISPRRYTTVDFILAQLRAPPPGAT
jgi:hypothetical protein